MPENANHPLLKCWKAVAPTGLPILLLKAPTTKPRGEEFDYVRYLIEHAGRNSRVVVKVVEGAGHTFSNQTGRSGVRELTEGWLTLYFPLPGYEADTRSFRHEAADLSSASPQGRDDKFIYTT